MNTFLSRLNAMFAFSLSVTAGVTFACFLTTHFNDNREDVSIDINRIIVKNMEEFYVGQKHDLGHLQFSLKANMTPVFNWNCKQLFLYLLAEYETTKNKVNQVVLWDKIIMRGQDANLNINKMNTKYYFFDDGSDLRGRKVTLSLHWNVIPNSGYLWRVRGNGNLTITVPDAYGTSRI
uniref:Signal peptidase complex subunit 3 n=1 Tax=Phallusia mammillata TaxID=59560 RepID=A0A6F9DUH2_9ASCI|nr:signal peptidase complex subunit 3-like [Phallusia mammillata]